MSVDISVIMPLYNAKDYFKLAVDSILSQTHKNLEVVIVDDCSTDGSLDLCRELYSNDARVKILKQPQNMGPGAARNTGITSASGNYICYVDSDDEIIPEHLSNMFNIATEYDADVVHNSHCFTVLPKKGEEVPLEMLGLPQDMMLSFSPDKKQITQPTLLSDDPSQRLEDWVNHSYHFSVWNSMYRRSLLMENNIRFDNMRLAEDAVFYFQCMFKARRFVARPGAGYLYRVAGSSSSRSGKSPEGAVKAMQAQLDVVSAMDRIMDTIPFFKDNKLNRSRAVDAILLNLEDGFVKPTFQTLGEQAMRSGEAMTAFFADNFGDKAPYVEFLFYELHKLYPSVIDYIEITGDVDKWRELKE